MTQVHEWKWGVGPAAAAIEADEASKTTTTTHSGTLSPGPFETEAEARSWDDIPKGSVGRWGGFSVYQKTADGKWWRQFWSTTTFLPDDEWEKWKEHRRKTLEAK